MVMTRATQTRIIAFGLGALALVGAASAAFVVPTLGDEGENTVRVDSFEDNHLQAEYVLTFEAAESGGDVHVSLKDADLTLVPRTGEYTGLGQVVENSESRSPSCTTGCFVTTARLEAISYPGFDDSPQRLWVGWQLNPESASDGTSLVMFKARMPGTRTPSSAPVGDGPFDGDWQAYGTWQLNVVPFTTSYRENALGFTAYSVTQDPVVTETFEVVRA